MAVIDSIGLGALGFTLLINVCEVKGGVQGIPWPEQMHEALVVMVWVRERICSPSG